MTVTYDASLGDEIVQQYTVTCELRIPVHMGGR